MGGGYYINFNFTFMDPIISVVSLYLRLQKITLLFEFCRLQDTMA